MGRGCSLFGKIEYIHRNIKSESLQLCGSHLNSHSRNIHQKNGLVEAPAREKSHPGGGGDGQTAGGDGGGLEDVRQSTQGEAAEPGGATLTEAQGRGKRSREGRPARVLETGSFLSPQIIMKDYYRAPGRLPVSENMLVKDTGLLPSWPFYKEAPHGQANNREAQAFPIPIAAVGSQKQGDGAGSARGFF